LSASEAFPRFEDIRQIAAAEEREAARKQAATEGELLALYQQDNDALRAEIDRQKSDIEETLGLNNQLLEAAERERDEVRADVFALRSRVQVLEAALKNRGDVLQTGPLDSYADIDEWTRKHLAGHIWIAPKAIRETEKKGAFENLKLFEQTLVLLRDFFVPMKRQPGREKRESYEARLRQLHLEDERSFAQVGAIEKFPAYAVTYDSKRFWCNDHIKCGGGYDPRYMFRIYYHWHSDDQILLIGHMPTHLDNKVTN
jgi:hypothetical protein